MSDDLLQSVKAEEQRLIVELRGHPLYQKLEAVRAFISAYQNGQAGQSRDIVGSPNPPQNPERRGRKPGRRPGSKSGDAVALVSEYLTQIGHREPTSRIFEALTVRGATFTGNNPRAWLSSLLSGDASFNHVHGKGYGLWEWGEGDGPNGVAEPSSTKTSTPPEITQPDIMNLEDDTPNRN